MSQFRSLGSVSVTIPPDEEGFTGRECPQPECEGYFKVEFGTGLKGNGLPCHCPYCGHITGHDQFWTKGQIEYAKSVAKRKIVDTLHKDLKKMEFDHKPKGGFISMSMKFTPGRRTPIHQYQEERLETEVTCATCTLRYAVYGVFAFCPDCGLHNSLQILHGNLDVVRKMLDMAAGAEKELAEKLAENALEDCVSAFDGFGRELCRIYADRARNPAKLKQVSFQNLEAAKSTVLGTFGVDLSAHVAVDEWQSAVQSFQKRHVIAHKMGVVDQEYTAKTGDMRAVVGRKIGIGANEVSDLAAIVSKLATRLSEQLEKLARNP